MQGYYFGKPSIERAWDVARPAAPRRSVSGAG
jgi:hypothetical protein